jgi:hypothetical protein
MRFRLQRRSRARENNFNAPPAPTKFHEARRGVHSQLKDNFYWTSPNFDSAELAQRSLHRAIEILAPSAKLHATRIYDKHLLKKILGNPGLHDGVNAQPGRESGEAGTHPQTRTKKGNKHGGNMAQRQVE